MKLEADSVRVLYPGAATPSLDMVSFAVSSGELVAVAGPNGSGKTTLMRALLGLVPIAAGQVTLDARPLATWSRRAVAETIGALPQREEPAFPLTISEAVLMGRWSRLGPVAAAGAADRAAIADALARCDLVGFEQRGIDTLSGGEWQRVRLARALVASPRLLLLDEPTAALDMGHEMALFEFLRGLVRDGLGVLVITHDLNLAARFADRMVLLHHGRAVASGAPTTVLRPDVLAGVFEWPVEVTLRPDGAPQVRPLRRPDPAGSTPPSVPSA
jgi:iron complex transport system ATP-binding protein